MRIKSGSVRSRVEEFRESAMGRVSWPLPRFLYPATSASGGKAHPAREGVVSTVWRRCPGGVGTLRTLRRSRVLRPAAQPSPRTPAAP
jgi:hypothetical protein